MLPNPRLTKSGRAYVSTVIACGFVVVSSSVYQLVVEPIGYQWFLLAALTLISGSATVKLPSVPASISISETFVFTAVLLYGPAAGTLTVALDGLVISYWIAKRRREPYRALFNMSAPAVSAWCSSHLFFLAAGIQPLVIEATTLNKILPALFLFALTYFSLNSWLIAVAVSTETRVSPFRVWRDNFVWLSLNYFAGASVAVLLVFYTREVDIRYIGVIVPLLLVLYFTFKTSMDRVEDAHKHVAKVNRLYLSTIETLAMAIDAKDQITHGHIRRVQRYAVGLAREVGVRDDSLIKAIEAAALLHDMGKLAVPEYILNKPGKLTAAEFDKMKLHASVGADILSAIDFPYPVVPIVRHHHEAWDGTGYPAGLRSTDIPIGARILAVVDCFDALTSDRPYRPRLSDEDAINILQQRRGSMYDPLIVDTFSQVYRQLENEVTDALSQRPGALAPISSSALAHDVSSAQVRFAEISASTDESLTLFELANSIGSRSEMSDVAAALARHLRRLVPAAIIVLYRYDPGMDEIVAVHAYGESSREILGCRISLGQRLSGWVAANRQTIVNSDPALDLGDLARRSSPRLRSCISSPLLSENALVGVLTLYSDQADAFSDDHRRVLETVCHRIARRVAESVPCPSVRTTSSATTHIQEAVARLGQISLTDDVADHFILPASVIVVSVHRGSGSLGTSVSGHLARVTTVLATELSEGSKYFKIENGLLVVLNKTDEGGAMAFASKMFRLLESNVDPDAATLVPSVRVATAPFHGKTLDELLRVAAPAVPPDAQATPRFDIH